MRIWILRGLALGALLISLVSNLFIYRVIVYEVFFSDTTKSIEPDYGYELLFPYISNLFCLVVFILLLIRKSKSIVPLIIAIVNMAYVIVIAYILHIVHNYLAIEVRMGIGLIMLGFAAVILLITAFMHLWSSQKPVSASEDLLDDI